MTEVYTATNRTPDVCKITRIVLSETGDSYFTLKTGEDLDIKHWNPTIWMLAHTPEGALRACKRWAKQFAEQYDFERAEG